LSTLFSKAKDIFSAPYFLMIVSRDMNYLSLVIIRDLKRKYNITANSALKGRLSSIL
jgi:hypothetical protein